MPRVEFVLFIMYHTIPRAPTPKYTKQSALTKLFKREAFK